jgi:hypothetical protein
MKLGKRPAKHDPRNLKLCTYLAESIPSAPDKIDWTHGVTSFGMMKNDVLGCCTCAAIAHSWQIWSMNSSSELTISDEQVVSLYETFCGYNPNDPNTDQGGIESDILKNWRANGALGHKIDAYASITPKNHPEVKQAINLFGVIYVGVALPNTAQNQPDIWDIVEVQDGSDEPGSWGGHAIICVGYDETFVYFISWGRIMKMTWKFLDKYMDEAYAIISYDWLNKDGKTPEGLDITSLENDLKYV